MLSNKWTFSLTCLVLMLSLCFVASSALAQFEIKLSAEDEDVSHADNAQVVYSDGTGDAETTTIKIMSTKVVNRGDTGGPPGTDTLTAAAAATTGIEALDFTVIAYNEFGGTVTLDPALAMLPVAIDGTADGMHFMANLPEVADTTGITRVLIVLKAGEVELADPRAELADDGTRNAAGKNKEASIELHYVGATEGTASDVDGDATGSRAAPAAGVPIVYSIERAGSELRPVTADTFEVLITLSEEPKKDGFKKDHIDASNATAGDPTFLDKIDQTATDADPVMLSSGRDMMLYRYIVVITPKYENKNDIVVKVKSFYDQEKSEPNMYMPPATPGAYIEGTDMLTVKVGKEDLKDKKAGVRVALPKDKVIPAGGYLVVAESKAGSEIVAPATGDDAAPDKTKDAGGQLLYKIIEAAGIPNLETFLANGGVIDVEGPHALIISEIMWGSDASLGPPDNEPADSQWIELYNPGAEYKTQDGDNTTYLNFYGPADTLPARADVHDRAGTIDAAGAYWSIAGIGQSGRTGTGEKAADIVAVVPTQELISMQRTIEQVTIVAGAVVGTDVIGLTATAGIRVSDGQMKSSWMASDPPGINFQGDAVGVRIANPGAATFTFADPVVEEPEVTVPVAEASDIVITEIMVDTGDGRLPQWIELSNVSGGDVSLAGWSLVIVNAADDADAIGERVEIDLSDSPVLGVSAHTGNTGQGKTLLLVAGNARSSSNISGSDRVVDVSSKVGETGRYTLISEMAFMLALLPPQKTGVLTYGDTAGNLGAAEAWDIPSSASGRSSLIRREMLDDGMATMGTDANGWVLASDTALVSGPTTWYGSDEDAGTPGYDAGGPLPVELSHFRPARDKQTGAVVITWSTQSELNNAGFFIKRSQQRDGQFQVVNPTMIAGAGTTSEKQFYTYTDTTAQPNVVYYYQIEDVSLDGNRQTLTRGIRLKGHIGAAGKLTTTWGDLKTQE
ncbi:hypothetical protein C6500_10855 [Candidatus Poribacteria bacterium]|nr:MAG: hypothetical protein C6500_10855 [Candidatus Poribacteria bacterium]